MVQKRSSEFKGVIVQNVYALYKKFSHVAVYN